MGEEYGWAAAVVLGATDVTTGGADATTGEAGVPTAMMLWVSSRGGESDRNLLEAGMPPARSSNLAWEMACSEIVTLSMREDCAGSVS